MSLSFNFNLAKNVDDYLVNGRLGGRGYSVESFHSRVRNGTPPRLKTKKTIFVLFKRRGGFKGARGPRSPCEKSGPLWTSPTA